MEMEQGGKTAHGWAARDASGHLSPYSFSARSVDVSLTQPFFSWLKF